MTLFKPETNPEAGPFRCQYFLCVVFDICVVTLEYCTFNMIQICSQNLMQHFAAFFLIPDEDADSDGNHSPTQQKQNHPAFAPGCIYQRIPRNPSCADFQKNSAAWSPQSAHPKAMNIESFA